MRLILVAALLSFGCAGSTVTFTDSRGNLVTLEQSIGGRGCMAATWTPEGDFDFVIQQDGSSDWGGIRAIPTLAQVAITAVLGDRRAESEGMDGPSDIQGCAGLFERGEWDD